MIITERDFLEPGLKMMKLLHKYFETEHINKWTWLGGARFLTVGEGSYKKQRENARMNHVVLH